MNVKRLVAAGLLMTMLANNVLTSVPVSAASGGDTEVVTDTVTETVTETTVDTENQLSETGLWITEIYDNDCDRDGNSGDQMDFIELTNTSDSEVSFDDYSLTCNEEAITLNESNVTIAAGETVVLWNKRDTTTFSEEDFRETMNINDDSVNIYTVKEDTDWGTSSSTYTLAKTDGTICSSYTTDDPESIGIGASVELMIPEYGYEMDVYRSYSLPSPGTAYVGQLNDQVEADVPEDVNPEGLYITEIYADDVARRDYYGVNTEYFDCFEITNTNDYDINLNEEYDIVYYRYGNRTTFNIMTYGDYSSECIIPANTTAVIWAYMEGESESPEHPIEATHEEFRAAHNIADDVPVFIINSEQDGLMNGNSGYEIYQKNDDSTRTLVSSYFYRDEDDNQAKTIELMVNPEGTDMLIYNQDSKGTLGTVSDEQITYALNDDTSIGIEPADTVPESITQGEYLSVEFNLTDSSRTRSNMTIYYRFDGEGKWYHTTETIQRVQSKYFARISADELFNHTYVEFYVRGTDIYKNSRTQIYTVNITQINDVDGVRTNISDGEAISGTYTITANDGEDNANTSIYIDGESVETTPMLEDGAYLSFVLNGRGNYYKNALTTTDDEVIQQLVAWMNTDLNGKAVHIDNQYFEYDEENQQYTVTLRFRSGSPGTSLGVDALKSNAARGAYTVTQLQLLLANGESLLPSSITGMNLSYTNTDTSLDAVHDLRKKNLYIDATFEIPVDEVTAVGYELDTTTMTDGTHTLTVSSGSSVKTVTFTVDNSAPVITSSIEDGSVLTGNIDFTPQIEDDSYIEELKVYIDGEEVESPYNVSAADLEEGEHTLLIYAEDEAGNYAESTVAFTRGDIDIEITDLSVEDVTDTSATLVATVGENTDDAEVTFYEGKTLDTSDFSSISEDGILPYIQYTVDTGDLEGDDEVYVNWDGTASSSDSTHALNMFVMNINTEEWESIGTADEDGSIETSFVAQDHVQDGKATVIVQCTADSALPQTDTDKYNQSTETTETETEEVVTETISSSEVEADDTTTEDTDTEDTDTEDTDTEEESDSWDGTSVPENYDFSFAWITDTQFYAESYQEHNINQSQWIVDNADDLGIKYVIHTGDLVDEYDMTYQWENASAALDILEEANMPYGVLAGNHDVAGGSDYYENYYQYFGEDRFESQSTYGGSYDNNKGHYDLISENGQDLIIVYMSWDIYTDEIDWINDVLAQYSDRKAILCFHRYCNVVVDSDWTLLDYAGKTIQENVVAQNSNVIAVLNGHYHGSSYETTQFDDDDDGVYDRTVYQICTDYQRGFEGGGEYIKMLYFDLDNDKIYINSYSPYYDDYNYYDTEVEELDGDESPKTSIDALILNVDFDAKTEETISESSFSAYIRTANVIGTSTVDSTNTASCVWNGLDASTSYAWYAVASNSLAGSQTSELDQLITETATSDSGTDTGTGTDTDDTDTGGTVTDTDDSSGSATDSTTDSTTGGTTDSDTGTSTQTDAVTTDETSESADTEEQADTDSSSDQSEDTTVQTGENDMLMLWYCIAALTGSLLIFMVVTQQGKRKRQKTIKKRE